MSRQYISNINLLGSTNAYTRFVADFPDKAEMSLNYSAIFDRTDKRNTPFESVKLIHSGMKYVTVFMNG